MSLLMPPQNGNAPRPTSDAADRHVPSPAAARTHGRAEAVPEPAARAAAMAQAQRLRDLWSDARDQARSAPAGSAAFARVADLAAADAAMAVRAGQPQQARAVVGDALDRKSTRLNPVTL